MAKNSIKANFKCAICTFIHTYLNTSKCEQEWIFQRSSLYGIPVWTNPRKILVVAFTSAAAVIALIMFAKKKKKKDYTALAESADFLCFVYRLHTEAARSNISTMVKSITKGAKLCGGWNCELHFASVSCLSRPPDCNQTFRYVPHFIGKFVSKTKERQFIMIS